MTSSATISLAKWWSRAFAFGVGLVMVGGFALSSPTIASIGLSSEPTSSLNIAVPLVGSITESKTTFATVVMGTTSGSFNLFWQLFSLNPSSGRFALVTPPGVADNGGLMVAAEDSGSAALVGFGTSQDLKFSPLALTANDGRSWSPGGLGSGLVKVPSSLAFGPDSSAAALVNGSGQSVVVRSGSLTDWRTLVTKKGLEATPGGKACGIASLDAVDIDQSGDKLIGTSCSRPGIPGVYVDSDAQWHLADIPVPLKMAGDSFAELRLTTTGRTTAGLFAATHAKTTDLVATWETSTARPWTLSPGLQLRSGDQLVASGTGSGTTQFVLIRHKGSLQAETIAGPDAQWHLVRALPENTATLAFWPNGQLDALSVSDTKFTAWQLGASGRSWTKVQSLQVPIAFGSSG